jgi:hypothetical protein
LGPLLGSAHLVRIGATHSALFAASCLKRSEILYGSTLKIGRELRTQIRMRVAECWRASAASASMNCSVSSTV